MKTRKTVAIYSALLLSQSLAAQTPTTPPGLQQLPPGRLEQRIEMLPPPARARALEWLARFDFPIEDLSTLDVDADGGVLYVDPRLDVADEITGESEPLPAGLSQTETFSLHSNPNATNVVYLDVDGHTIAGTAWNAGAAASYAAMAFDRDGNVASFSQSELDDIAEIWHRIAEDLAPFDIDVTTEEPSSFGPSVGRILVTNNVDAGGVSMPYANGGGVAYVDVWGRSDFTFYQPALVYYNNLGGGQPRYVAEASSHELGHNLALSHDGTTTGTTYYAGHGAGFVEWAPIMGNSYGSQVSQWSRGEYNAANNAQDDTAIIAGKLDLREDDHADFFNTATPLNVAADGTIDATDPEIDPFNSAPANKGIIEVRGDVDIFSFSAANGLIDLEAVPAWIAFRNDNSRGANLDILASLYDANGEFIVDSDPAMDTNARLQVNVPGGVYYLAISAVGAGDPTNSYNDYASQGQYFINGLIAADTLNQPPVAENDGASVDEDGVLSASVLTNDSDDDGDTLSIVSLSAPTGGSASTDGLSISYTPDLNVYGSDSLDYVISDGRGGTDSATLTITINAINDVPSAIDDSYTVDAGSSTSLAVLDNDSDVDSPSLTIVGTTTATNGTVSIASDGGSLIYTANAGYAGSDSVDYTVADGAGATATAGVELTVLEAVVPPSTPTIGTATNNANGSATINWQGAGQVQSFEVQRETRHKKRDAWNGTAIIGTATGDATSYVDSPGANTYRYHVRALNTGGVSAWSGWVEVTITDSSGGGGNGNGGGGNGNGNGNGKPKR